MKSTARAIALLLAAAVVVALSASTPAAQGRGKGHGGAPPAKPPAPAHVAKPATPPGHARVPKPAAPKPAVRVAKSPAKPVTVVRPGGLAPALIVRLTPLFPPRTDINLAAAGFKNRGQFVAAANVSRNLGIPFDALKARMTGPNPVSLGQAIQELRPTARVDFEVRRAEAVAREWTRRR